MSVEDYLLGVVPYEMSDSFPLEALKAQAVCARTYALSHDQLRLSAVAGAVKAFRQLAVVHADNPRRLLHGARAV